MTGTKIDKRGSLLLRKKIENIDISAVYIPITSTQLKIGDKVKEGELIGIYHSLNVYASLSGEVINFDKKNTIRGEEEVVLIKKNKEDIIKVKVNENIDREDFIKLLNVYSIIGLGGAGFPTYKKYDVPNIDTLIINAVECEPYIMADYALILEHAKEIVDAIYKIMKINNIKKSYIGIKKNNVDIINSLKKYIKDDCLEIALVPSLYPMGWERLLIKKITNTTYNKLPIEKGIVVNNISTIYAIGRLLKGYPLTERVITVSGDLATPKSIRIKNGTLVGDILKDLNIENDDYIVIAGGPMMGKEITPDFVLTNQVNCLLIMPKKNDKVLSCLRCGKCVGVCPVKLEPVLIKDSINNKEVLEKLDVNRCIECGLCSYVCPSNIPLRDYVISSKEKVGGD